MKLTNDMIGKYVTRTGPSFRIGKPDYSYIGDKLLFKDIRNNCFIFDTRISNDYPLYFPEYDDDNWEFYSQGNCDHLLAKLSNRKYCFDCGARIIQ